MNESKDISLEGGFKKIYVFESLYFAVDGNATSKMVRIVPVES